MWLFRISLIYNNSNLHLHIMRFLNIWSQPFKKDYLQVRNICSWNWCIGFNFKVNLRPPKASSAQQFYALILIQQVYLLLLIATLLLQFSGKHHLSLIFCSTTMLIYIVFSRKSYNLSPIQSLRILVPPFVLAYIIFYLPQFMLYHLLMQSTLYSAKYVRFHQADFVHTG
jgi:hypothetical protein